MNITGPVGKAKDIQMVVHIIGCGSVVGVRKLKVFWRNQMEIQCGKNPEVTLGVTYNWGKWGLPFSLSVWTYNYHDSSRHSDITFAKHFSINVDFLCIRFYIEAWRWKK